MVFPPMMMMPRHGRLMMITIMMMVSCGFDGRFWLAIVINIILHWLFWQKRSVKLTFAPPCEMFNELCIIIIIIIEKIRRATCCNIAAMQLLGCRRTGSIPRCFFCLLFYFWAGPQNWLRGKTKLKTQKWSPKHIWHSFGVDRVQQQSVHQKKLSEQAIQN